MARAAFDDTKFISATFYFINSTNNRELWAIDLDITVLIGSSTAQVQNNVCFVVNKSSNIHVFFLCNSWFIDVTYGFIFCFIKILVFWYINLHYEKLKYFELYFFITQITDFKHLQNNFGTLYCYSWRQSTEPQNKSGGKRKDDVRRFGTSLN